MRSVLPLRAFAAILLCTVGMASQDAAAQATITAAATASQTSCAAPCAVHFDAAGTGYAGQSEADKYLSLDYRWNFGDEDAGSWAEGARSRGGMPQSKNVEYGFEAAHVYEQAGSYDVMLSVTDGTSSDQLNAPIRITVTAGDSQWSGQQTICIGATAAPVAGSGGCPAGARVFQQSDFNAAVETQCNIDAAAVRCLLKGGDSFTASRASVIANTGPSLLGSFGSGKARVTVNGGPALLRLDDGNTSFRMVDLNLIGDPDFSAGSQAGVFIDTYRGHMITKFLALRVDMTDFDSGYFFRGDYPAYTPPTTHMLSEFAWIDSTITRSPGRSGHEIFLMGNKVAIMGSRMADRYTVGATDPSSHVVRSKYLRKAIYAHNAFGLLNAGVAANYGCFPNAANQGNLVLKFVAGFAVDMPNPADGWSQEVIISDNYISRCRDNAWDVTIAPTDSGAQKAKEHLQFFVVEGNLFTAHNNTRASGSAKYLHIANTSHLVIRNNVFDATSPGSQMSNRALSVESNPNQFGTPGYVAAEDIRILNNTFYQGTSSSASRTFATIAGSDVTDVQLSNNLMYSPDSSAALFTLNAQAPDQPVCCGGTCPGSCNIKVTSSPFVTPPTLPSTLGQFALRSGVTAINSGFAVSGRAARDAAGSCRSGTWDVGAFEVGAAACPGTPTSVAVSPPSPPTLVIE